ILLYAISFPRQYFDKLRIGAKKDAASIRARAAHKKLYSAFMETIINKQYIIQILKPVASDAHKGTQGHVLIIGGSYGKIGAVCLASKAALRTGSGLVTAFIPECGYDIIQTAIPEVMALTDSNFKHLSNIEFDIKPNAIGIGPGMGQEPQS